MKVLGLAADSGGCGFYRMRAPAREAKLLGIDITIATEVHVEASKDSKTEVVTVTEVQTDADLIIFQRPLDHAMTSVIKQAKRQGIATIVEIDDDFSTVHESNVAYSAMNGQHSGHQWVAAAAAEADLVTISTPQLAKYARHGRYEVLRNCVPDTIFDTPIQKTDQQWPRVGWTGTVQTHPNDLQETRGRLKNLLLDNGLPFNVVGDGQYVGTHLGLSKETPVHATGWVDLDLYYQYVGGFIDIGIVPLELSAFNQAKSSLKGLEYAALGIPFVASPTREYELLEINGIGKIAKSPGDWAKHIQRMIDRPAETERIANEARDRIRANHTYSVNAPKWIEAWEKAIDYRKTHPHE